MTLISKIGLGVVIAVTAFLTFLTFKLPYLPGDVFCAKLIQSALPADTGWANWVTSLASFPSSAIIIVIIFFCSYFINGMRAAFLVLGSFGGVLIMDKLFRLVIFQPRPTPELIHVASALPGSAFPSTAAFVFAATFGYLCVLIVKTGKESVSSLIVLILSAINLIIGFAARIALGAHWPSDIIVSYLWAYLWVLFLLWDI